MTPLQFDTMMIIPLTEPTRLRLPKSHDLVMNVQICWAMKWFFKSSPFHPTDYRVQTIGLDGVA